MKIQVKLIVSFFILLLVCSPTLAAIPSDLKVPNTNNQPGKLGVSYNPSSFNVSKTYSPLMGSSRIGLVSGNVAKYKIKVKVGSGEYDNVILTNYVQEESP